MTPPSGSRLSVHIGHHFFGAGNIGDDLVLAGFHTCIRDRLRTLHLTCCTPHDLASQKRRFPFIDWLAYTPELREQAIAQADVWLGLGGSPFQSDDSDWFIDHLAQEEAACRRHRVPMHYLGVGVNNESVFHRAEVRSLLDRAECLWARDPRSRRLMQEYAKRPQKVHLGSDLSHCFLESQAAPEGTGALGLCLSFMEDPREHRRDIEAFVASLPDPRPLWLVQEVRHLPNSELRVLSLLGATATERLVPCVPDYSAACTEDLLRAWPRCAGLISSRYHAALVHAWRGTRVGVVGINDKLRGIAEDLELACFSSISEAPLSAAAISLRVVPRALLENRAGLARASVAAWFDHLPALGSLPSGAPVRVEAPVPPLRRPRTEFNRLLVTCSDSLGDIVLREPLFRALLDAGYELSVAASESGCELLALIDGRIQTIPLGFDPYRRGNHPDYADAISQFVGRVQAEGFDSVACPLFNRTIAEEVLLTRLPQIQRIGFTPGVPAVIRAEEVFSGADSAADPASLFSRAVSAEARWHETVKYDELLRRAFGIDLDDYEPALKLAPEAVDAAVNSLSKLALSPQGYIICCPVGGANVQIKAVPDSLLVAVARGLDGKSSLPFLLVGIESERGRLERLRDACAAEGARAHVWIGGPGLLGCLLGLTSQARLYFGADTGPMHFAAALRIPVAVVMGGGTYPRFLPVARQSYIAVNRLDCFGCSWQCRFDEPRCIESLDSKPIVAGIRRLLKKTESPVPVDG